jgi:hypothetical protein
MKPHVLIGVCLVALSASTRGADKMERVRVSADQRGFILSESKKPFVPWGFNYDHDEKGRLIEDYWHEEWPKIEEDFREMKELGANLVRIHLQVGKFLEAKDRSHAQSLKRLGELLKLSEALGIYLDLTGLGCYHKKDVPAWYDELSEEERWEAQAFFWESVAKQCAASPAVFCYDLMNEPVVPGGKRKGTDWLGPAFAGKHFVQFITLDTGNRARPEVARAWTKRLVKAIRKQDRNGLITVGLVPWSLDRPGLTSGFVPEKIAADLDFVSVHIYPEKGKLDDALATLRGFSVGKPVVIEEIFPLKCGTAELADFIKESENTAAGWVGFYWGKTIAECRKSKSLPDALMLEWLQLFRKQPR